MELIVAMLLPRYLMNGVLFILKLLSSAFRLSVEIVISSMEFSNGFSLVVGKISNFILKSHSSKFIRNGHWSGPSTVEKINQVVKTKMIEDSEPRKKNVECA